MKERNPQARTPYSNIMKRPSKYIDSDFTPPGFQWKDPAHLKAQECKNLLGHWYARQQKNLVPFQFRGDYGEGFIRRAKQKAKYVEPDPTRACAAFWGFSFCISG
jgi:hypothetical protein